MTNQKHIHLSVVIPAYNEEANLSLTLEDIIEFLKSKDYTYEVIVVDDGSADRTYEIASSFGKLFQNFTLLKNHVNRGKGYSVKRGVLAAKGEFILFMDADNSTRINQLEKFITTINDGYDVAIGSRRIPGAIIEIKQPLTRIILGNIYILLSKLILGTRVKDYNCGFKLFKKDVAGFLFSRITQDDWSFDSELIYLVSKYKYKIKEVPVRWEDKRTSKVKPFRDGIKSFWSILKIKFQTRLT
jgi:dolichyl-phosphate beta-glucosyltransferase